MALESRSFQGVSPPQPIAPVPSFDSLKTGDLQRILVLAAKAVSALGSANADCLGKLDQIEGEIEATATIEAGRVLRFRLAECLQKLREHTRHQQGEMLQLLTQMEEQLEVVRGNKALEGKGLLPAVDSLSGLDVREAAEQALSAAMQRGGKSYVALFVVDRLHLINAQFGYSTGDRVLRSVCGHLQSFLSSQDQLFRWTGPAFVALLDQNEDRAGIQANIERIASFKLETGVQIGNRSILVPVSCASMLLSLSDAGSLPDITARLDTFTSERVRR